METMNWLENELKRFATRYYFNAFLQRLALFILACFIVVLSFSIAEYAFWFEKGIRVFLFWGFVFLNVSLFSVFLAQPLLRLAGFRQQLSHRDFALIIGRHFPEINDRILNVLELSKENSSSASIDLIKASIEQKTKEIRFVRFFDALDRRKTIRRIPLLAIPLLAMLVMGFTSPSLLLDPLGRISRYNTEFEKPAPFRFEVLRLSDEVPQNSDVEIVVKLIGEEIPEEVFLDDGVRRLKMLPEGNNTFRYVASSLQKNLSFRFFADEYYSSPHLVKVFKMPSIVSYSIHLSYPSYTGKQSEVVNNVNSMSVPRGTYARFFVLTRDADVLSVSDGENSLLVRKGERYFEFDRVLDRQLLLYAVSSRKEVKAADSLEFMFQVVPDEYPVISVREEIDSTMFMLRYFSGRISDDYGISRLQFSFRYISDNVSIDSSFNIPVSTEYSLQEFYNAFDFSTFQLKAGDKIEYYFTVFDNDIYGGPKSSKSQIFTFRMPSEEELREMYNAQSTAVSGSMEELMEETKSIQKELDDFMNKIAGKKKLSWEEQEKLKELLDREKQLEENLNQINQQNSERIRLGEQMSDFNEQIFEKQRMIDELMNQIMDDEFRDLLEKLQKMMEKNNSNLNNDLEKLNEMNEEILRSMDQTLELLKRTEVEEKINQLAKDLNEKGEQADDLSKSSNPLDQRKKEQELLNSQFTELQKLADSLMSKNNELEEPFQLDSLNEMLNEIDSTLNESLNQLNSGKENKASKSQKEAGQKMKDLAKQLENMMQEMEMEQQVEDMNLLREILENLITLSFKQEDLMRLVSKTRVADPQYFENMRKQKRLDEGLAIIDDSLTALGKRNPMIDSYISDELLKINRSRGLTMEHLSNRSVAQATKEQQSIMMGMNNLAVLLSEVLRQMQDQANQQQQSQQNGNSQCKNPGNNPGGKPGKGSKPSAKTLRQLQEQLNQQMEGLKKQMESGKEPGQGQPGFSEQLAKMAAQQEAIRKAMQEYQQQLNSEGAGQGQQLNKVINDMEKTEEDLVNKRLTQETLNRQKQIETRLLESEKAELEREKDPKRQSEEAKVFNNGNPMTFFKYNSLKRNSSEILKTVPPNLNPYYKQKVNDYLYKLK